VCEELVRRVRTEIGPIASPDLIQFAPNLPKTRSGKIMRRILRKIAEDEYGNLGDTSTLADPAVVDDLVNNRQNKSKESAQFLPLPLVGRGRGGGREVGRERRRLALCSPQRPRITSRPPPLPPHKGEGAVSVRSRRAQKFRETLPCSSGASECAHGLDYGESRLAIVAYRSI
jgi:hypothetical protein